MLLLTVTINKSASWKTVKDEMASFSAFRKRGIQLHNATKSQMAKNTVIPSTNYFLSISVYDRLRNYCCIYPPLFHCKECGAFPRSAPIYLLAYITVINF